jgi:hypothetical protein
MLLSSPMRMRLRVRSLIDRACPYRGSIQPLMVFLSFSLFNEYKKGKSTSSSIVSTRSNPLRSFIGYWISESWWESAVKIVRVVWKEGRRKIKFPDTFGPIS